MVAIAVVYRSASAVAGGYVAAALAPNRPVRRTAALGLVGVMLGILGAAATRGTTPAWFNVALLVLGLPCVLLGAKLQNGRSANRVRDRRAA